MLKKISTQMCIQLSSSRHERQYNEQVKSKGKWIHFRYDINQGIEKVYCEMKRNEQRISIQNEKFQAVSQSLKCLYMVYFITSMYPCFFAAKDGLV